MYLTCYSSNCIWHVIGSNYVGYVNKAGYTHLLFVVNLLVVIVFDMLLVVIVFDMLLVIIMFDMLVSPVEVLLKPL